MLLIIEIVLTIFAWRNGWKWLALLPIGIAFAVGFFIGYGVALSGGTTDISSVVFLDIIAVIALIIMCIKKRE